MLLQPRDAACPIFLPAISGLDPLITNIGPGLVFGGEVTPTVFDMLTAALPAVLRCVRPIDSAER